MKSFAITGLLITETDHADGRMMDLTTLELVMVFDAVTSLLMAHCASKSLLRGANLTETLNKAQTDVSIP